MILIGVNPPLAPPQPTPTPPRRGVRSQPTPSPSWEGERNSGGKKEEKRGIEGESFLFSWRTTHVNAAQQVKRSIPHRKPVSGTEFYRSLIQT
ncbi:MAG: hypothetical protein F6K48_29140 [Okeania sp. SIO3H1]|uniref:hypothetical protein n=1 Tax=Okeania sp. SIO1I7 TaxID=2607772 RepID=UPI0013C7C770|nr:hypothetical protein [Okeania sp. SIO1I7]NEN92742.1 hypothetical protein [Okeania sp. SIO3H1]NET25867.1 hypothetical protein [Okeania sp. SIO1I7]